MGIGQVTFVQSLGSRGIISLSYVYHDIYG